MTDQEWNALRTNHDYLRAQNTAPWNVEGGYNVRRWTYGGHTYTEKQQGVHYDAIFIAGLPKGMGAATDDLQTAGAAVMAYFASHPCTQAKVTEVETFQLTYNASGMPGQLTVDGQYGGNTQRALQNVLNTAPAAGGGGPVQQAPQNCFGMSVPDIPALDAPTAPATTTTTTTTPAASTSSVSPTAVALAVAAVVGGVGYAVYRARKRRH
jgi:hypothetical protein